MTIVKIRASSLGRLFDCPASWAATHIDGKRMPTNGKALLGTAVHASTAVYDRSTIRGDGLTPDEAAAAAVDAIYKPVDDVMWDDDKPSDVESIALALHKKYCTEIAPTKTYKAVEVECKSLEISDLGIALTGTTDRIIETDDGLGIADIKTGKTAVNANGTVETKGHAYQLGIYELLAEAVEQLPITAPAQIIAMNTAKTPASQRTGTGIIENARSTLLGDGESPGVLEYAAKIIHSGSFWGNPKSMLCHDKYCPIFATCKFRK